VRVPKTPEHPIMRAEIFHNNLSKEEGKYSFHAVACKPPYAALARQRTKRINAFSLVDNVPISGQFEISPATKSNERW
jgi:hypothetical protein